MPQLDKVTLFSQVFWLIFLYFFFFLVFLRYYLPKFSKLFKIRYYYLSSRSSSNEEKNKSLRDFSYFSSILSKFNILLKENLSSTLDNYNSVIKSYNSTFLKKINNLFIAVYVYNCLKFNLYKKLYL